MGMILEYDQSPKATVDQKVGTLKDSVQRALEDVEQSVEGKQGAPGVSVEDIIEQWCLSNSKLSAVGSAWTYDQPEWKSNHYLWTRNEVHYSDGSVRYTTPGLADALNSAYEAAYAAREILDDVEVRVSTAEQTVTEIKALSEATKALADSANENAESAKTQVTQLNAELAEADRQIQVLTQELETVENTMEANYATKGELTEVNTALGTQISQNAAEINATAAKVQEIDIDATQALSDAANARSAADEAASKATEAQEKYTALKSQADVTDEKLEAAKTAVQQAQADATAAADAAAAAQSAADSLSDRVLTCESQIKQSAEQISLTVTKVEKAQTTANAAAQKVEVQYALSDSTTTAPTDGWSTVAPEWTEGKYMWQKTVVTNGKGEISESAATCISGATGQAGEAGEDAVLLRIDSSRGTVFKNNAIATVMSVAIYKGSEQVTDANKLHQVFGADAYLQWYWQKIDEETYGLISAGDTRLSDGGFKFTITPDDVDAKVTFKCELMA